MTTPDPDAIAHGHAPAAAEDKLLVAVFASPVASFLLRYAADVGYRTVLAEPDPELARIASAMGTEVIDGVASIAHLATQDADVVVTDHHRTELGVQLRDALASGARWVGIMGNPRVDAPHVSALADLGVPPDEIDRVHRPIGLNIGSRTPAEIAIATLAGLIADRKEKPGGFAF